MNFQIDEMSLILMIVSTAITVVITVIGAVWKLLDVFKTDFVYHLNLIEKGLEDRQEAWRKLLETYIQAQKIQFKNLHELRHELILIQKDLKDDYPTRLEMHEKLSSIRIVIEEIRRIVDSRVQRGVDPVSGRPTTEKQ